MRIERLLHLIREKWWIFGLIGMGLIMAGCQGYMISQPRYDPLSYSEVFADGRSARPLPTGVVSLTDPVVPGAFYTGKDANGNDVTTFPISVTLQTIQRGQQRFNIYCAPCHGYGGYGDGMIVQRGFSPPPSYHTNRLRQAPVGHFFDVITNGFGTMYAYAYRVAPEDRWAIIAYIRALQFSQDARQSDVPPADLPQLNGGK